MLTIIGCGNLNRSDDGVGVVVAQRLRNSLCGEVHPKVQVFDAGTGGAEIMFMARGSDKLVLVDACRSGADPGAVFRVPGTELATDYKPSYSLHDFRWDHALFAGRQIFGDQFPDDTTVFLIEAAQLELGLDLSDPVSRAANLVVTEIESLVASYVAVPKH